MTDFVLNENVKKFLRRFGKNLKTQADDAVTSIATNKHTDRLGDKYDRKDRIDAIRKNKMTKESELLGTVINRNPTDFKALFEKIIVEKISHAVELVKQDLHQEAFKTLKKD